MHNQAGNYVAAITDFTASLTHFPNFDLALFNRAYTSEIGEQFEQAVADYTRAIESKPDDSEFYLRRGVSLKKLDRCVDARKDFAAVRRLRGK